jgi:hypothetical protein
VRPAVSADRLGNGLRIEAAQDHARSADRHERQELVATPVRQRSGVHHRRRRGEPQLGREHVEHRRHARALPARGALRPSGRPARIEDVVRSRGRGEARSGIAKHRLVGPCSWALAVDREDRCDRGRRVTAEAGEQLRRGDEHRSGAVLEDVPALVAAEAVADAHAEDAGARAPRRRPPRTRDSWADLNPARMS